MSTPSAQGHATPSDPTTATSTAAALVTAALKAATLTDAEAVQAMIRADLGTNDYRPLADTWNNHGLVGSSGNYDHKLIELVTNMQDAVVELAARRHYGLDGEIPYTSPHEATRDLFSGDDETEIAARAKVTLRESDPPAQRTKRLTVVFRDLGCGLTPDMVPRTIFRIGGSHKEDALYLQGAFGMGGAMTYRNAAAVVLVSRRDPHLLEQGQEDLITVAVVEWRANTKGSTAMYLVDQPWGEPGDPASPWSCPASAVPDFAPGTHIALISYRTDGIQRKTERDEASFNTIANTRLYDPVMPIQFTNETDRGRLTTLRGLHRRLTTTATEVPTATETLPFHAHGATHHLPVTFFLFDKRREAGGIDKFVAGGHRVIFTSNGQVHHHWDAAEFRQKTGFNKIHDRILVVVNTDELPILVRTNLFTADRNDLVRTDDAIRLEEAVAGFLKDWGELEEQNSILVRESLRAGSETASADLGRRIGRAFQATGYGGGNTNPGGGSGPGGAGGSTSGGGGGGGEGGGVRKKVTLHPDPTTVTGPGEIRVLPDRTRSVTFIVDVVDDFWRNRGTLSIETDHPDIGSRDITVGSGRAGRVRTMIAIPDTATLGTFQLTATLRDWHRAGGGLGPDLTWTTKMEVVAEIPPGGGSTTGSGTTGGVGGTGGTSRGSAVALRWTNHEHVDAWAKTTVGDVEDIAAAVLADELPDYAELAALGQTPIPVINLNEEYPPFKRYLQARSQALVDLHRPREQYALGVGLALLVIHDEEQQAQKRGEKSSDTLLAGAARAAARGILAVMPAFEEALKQAGVAPE